MDSSSPSRAFDGYTSSDDDRDLAAVIAVETRITFLRDYLRRCGDELDKMWEDEKENDKNRDNCK